MTAVNETKCDLAFQLTYHPIYRAAQFWTFFISLLAASSVLYFLVKRIFQLPFHKNLKSILIAYFIALFLFSILCCFAFGYHSIYPFFAKTKCDLILKVTLFKWLHVAILFLITVPMIMAVGFTIERSVAMAFAHKYEHSKTLLGPILVILLTSVNAFINWYIYRNETFDDPFVSFILIPSKSSVSWNNYYWFLLYFKIANFLANGVLLISHKRFSKSLSSHLRRRSTLSVRYEMQEIRISSRFTLIVSFTHLLFILWYLTSILFVRTMGEPFFNGYLNFTVARGIYCALPTYTLAIAIVATKALSHLNSKRQMKVQTTVQIKSTGKEGAINYDDAISRHWNSVVAKR